MVYSRWRFIHEEEALCPRVEDKNRNMRMINISRIDDMIANSMNILEPAPVDADGNEREDGKLIHLHIC